MDIKRTATDYPLFEIGEDKVRFYYNVSKPKVDHSFWTKAVDEAHYNRNHNKVSDVSCDDLKTVDIILVRTVLDYFCPDNSWYDWDTEIWVRIDNAGEEHYFLEEHYLSTWDDMPVYSGGEISQKLFKKYMKKIGNHNYRKK